MIIILIIGTLRGVPQSEGLVLSKSITGKIHKNKQKSKDNAERVKIQDSNMENTLAQGKGKTMEGHRKHQINPL